jgi:hypothetical protein
VRPQVLLDEDHPGGEGFRGEAECERGQMSEKFREKGGEIYLPTAS